MLGVKLRAGDEADICCYAVGCDSGRVIQTDKGSMTRPPLEAHESFDAFAAKATDPEAVVEEPPAPWWARSMTDHPLCFVFFWFFVVLPFCGFCIKLPWSWATGQPL